MDSWVGVPGALRALTKPLPEPWEAVFGPLRSSGRDNLMVVAQLGQSLDGRVATETGHSHYINGPEALAHLHMLWLDGTLRREMCADGIYRFSTD